MSARSMFRSRKGHRAKDRARITSPARAVCTLTKAASIPVSDQHFAAHETVLHSAGEYVRGDVHTNTAEGYFSIFKRGMRGVYQHCKEKHLHRYLANTISATITVLRLATTMAIVRRLL